MGYVEPCSNRRLTTWSVVTQRSTLVVRNGPGVDKMAPVVRIELERIEALELLAMTLAHLNDAEARADVLPIRDKLARGLREDQ